MVCDLRPGVLLLTGEFFLHKYHFALHMMRFEPPAVKIDLSNFREFFDFDTNHLWVIISMKIPKNFKKSQVAFTCRWLI